MVRVFVWDIGKMNMNEAMEIRFNLVKNCVRLKREWKKKSPHYAKVETVNKKKYKIKNKGTTWVSKRDSESSSCFDNKQTGDDAFFSIVFPTRKAERVRKASLRHTKKKRLGESKITICRWIVWSC